MEARAIVTEFVSNNFFDRSSRLFRFLNVVFSHYNEMMKKFRDENGLAEKDAFFIFKGGNVMRIVAKDFFLELPENTSRNIINYYSQFFKRSDADFSIYLNPNLENYDLYFFQLVQLAYHEQVKIKNILLSNETRYFDFFCYNDQHKRKLFSSLIKSLNFDNVRVGNEYYKEGIDDYKKVDDFFYLKNYDGYSKESIGKNDKYLYTSINQTFDDTTKKLWRTKFSLIRTKVHFVFQKDGRNKTIDGELIDVSIPHRNSNEINIFYKEVDKYVVTYTLRRKDEKLSFYSYTVEYLIKDLERILFLQNDRPWDDDKYAKRLNRLIFMYFIEMFSRVGNGEERIEVLKDVYKYFDDKSSSKRLYSNYDLSISKLIVYIEKINEEKLTAKDIKEMNKMYDIVKQNMTFFIESLENVKIYCRTDGNISEADISSIKINQYI